jgi:hypothetical protein
MNKQLGFNAEQIEKDKYPERKTVWRINLKTSEHSKAKTAWLIKLTSNNTRRLHISQRSPLSSKDLRLVVSIQTNHTCHITSTQLRDFFSYKGFFSLSPCWFFIWGGEWCKPPRNVPYKRTYVPCNGTFGTSYQGQTLDVWGDIQQMSSRCQPWGVSDRDVTISTGRNL